MSVSHSLARRIARGFILGFAALGVCLVIGATSSLAWAQPADDSILLRFSRTMGFRPQEWMNERSDYSFTVDADGHYEYQAFYSPDAEEGLKLSGDLPFPVEEFESRIAKLGIDEIPAPDPNEPQIADAPECHISRPGNGADWQRTVFPNTPYAKGLHALVGEIVMGIQEAPDEVIAELMKSEPAGMEPRWFDSADDLQDLLGDSAQEWIESIDFDKQKVGVVRWQGSGQDDMFAFRSGQGDDAEIKIAVTRGLTRDLRQHGRIYVVPKDIPVSVVNRKPPRFGR